MNTHLLSIVIPVYNEEKNLPILHTELCSVFERLSGFDFEVLFVDDGSADASWKGIQELANKDKRIAGISLSRNFGHQAALEAGFNSVNGDVIVMMDSDLEQPPSLIPTLIEKWQEGFMIVNTCRKSSREGRTLFKIITSYSFYKVFNTICDIQIQPASCDFRLVDRKVLDEMLKIRECDRYFSGLVAWTGFTATVVEYTDGVRRNGKPGYSVSKMVHLAYTAITTYSTVPLKIIVGVGLFIFSSSLVLITIMLLFNVVVGMQYFSDLAFLVVFIIINNGIILTVLGIMSAYLLRIHKSVQAKPNFIIEAVTNLRS